MNRVNEAAEARIAALEDKLSTAETKLKETEHRLEDVEAYSRRNSIIISGVPEAPAENTDRLVQDVARAAGFQLSAEMIDRSHRLGRPHPGKNRPIIAKFVSFNSRQQLYTKRKELTAEKVRDHPILTRSVVSKTYISECLTPKNQRLFYVARQLKKKKVLWAAYTTNGAVKVKRTEDELAKPVHSLDDLEPIVGADALREFRPRSTGTGAAPAQRSADRSWARADAVDSWVTERRRPRVPTTGDASQG